MLSLKYKHKRIDLASYILIGLCNFYLGFTLTKTLLYQFEAKESDKYFH